MRRVVVTGLGPLSPIAAGKDAYWRVLREGRNGIGPITSTNARGPAAGGFVRPGRTMSAIGD